MTTLAWNGATLAADSQQTGEFIRQVRCRKVFKYKGISYGTCGNISDALLFRAWLEKPQRFRPGKEFGALKIENGKAFELDSDLVWIPVGKPYAMGTGAAYALGAMLAGATAAKAVRIAIDCDPYSGGKVQCISTS